MKEFHRENEQLKAEKEQDTKDRMIRSATEDCFILNISSQTLISLGISVLKQLAAKGVGFLSK